MKILFIVTLFSTCLISQDVGYKLYKDGDIESALEYYKALIQLDNDDISREDILYNIGTIYSNIDRLSYVEHKILVQVDYSFQVISI